MNEKKYNGWTNYETWLAKLWMDNDEGSQTYWDEVATEAYEESEPAFDWQSNRDAARIDLAERLKGEHEATLDALGLGEAGLYADLMNAALSEVNWHEIAESLIEAVEEREPVNA